MRESSPAFGGVIIGAIIVLALIYSMGAGDRFMDMMSGLAAQGGDMLNTAYDAVRQAIVGAS
jgi:hypothetical protein